MVTVSFRVMWISEMVDRPVRHGEGVIFCDILQGWSID